jgi:acetyl-CoA carboxylase alpha subunit
MPETTPISTMGNCEDLADAIERALVALEKLPPERLTAERYAKFRRLGVFEEAVR